MMINMRNIRIFLTVIMVTLLSVLVFGCKNETIEIKLNFDSQSNTLFWSQIDSASTYEILIDNESVKTKNNESFYKLTSSYYGEHTIKVRALNALGIAISEYSNDLSIYVEKTLSEVLEDLTKEHIKSTVKVITRIDTLTGIEYFDGSGVIFKKQASQTTGYYEYYILTNNHVVAHGNSFNKAKYSVVDYMAETINGYDYNLSANNKVTVANNKVTVAFQSADYDLAVVKLISDNDYKVMPFAREDVSVGDKVISIGAPLGVVNSVTAGEVVKTDKKIETSSPEVSNVTFNVITHNAYLNDGSSGGVLMNYNYEIVGINFATGKSSNTGEFVEGYAVPVSKVKEFLTLNSEN